MEAMLNESFVTMTWRVFRFRRKNSCENDEYAVADSQQGVVLQMGLGGD
jgi:hypothetical protein